MAKQKQPIPSPLNRVLETGTIGGNSKTENRTYGSTEIMKSGEMEERNTGNMESSPKMKKQTIFISEKLAKRVKVHASLHDTSISDIATKALEQYLAREEE